MVVGILDDSRKPLLKYQTKSVTHCSFAMGVLTEFEANASRFPKLVSEKNQTGTDLWRFR